MNKSVFLTGGNHLCNLLMTQYLLEQGCSVSVACSDQDLADRLADSIPAVWRERLFFQFGTAQDASAMISQTVQLQGGLDFFIFGVDECDEIDCFEQDPFAFGQQTNDQFRDIFLYARSAASYMARKKQGHILFPLLSDVLYYDGYPSSPVYNHGKLTLMKSLAKELSPFRISVNAITLGYYKLETENLSKTELKQRLEIHTLKPYLPELQELIATALDLLFQTKSHLISGQNFHIGSGLDTVM